MIAIFLRRAQRCEYVRKCAALALSTTWRISVLVAWSRAVKPEEVRAGRPFARGRTFTSDRGQATGLWGKG